LDEKPPPGSARNHLAQAYMDFVEKISNSVGVSPEALKIYDRHHQ